MHNKVKKVAPSSKKNTSNKETLGINIALNDISFSVAVDMAWLSVNQMSHSFMHRLRDQHAFFNTYAKLTFGVSGVTIILAMLILFDISRLQLLTMEV